MKILRILALAALSLVSLHAAAQRQLVPIANYENLPFTSPGITEAQVRDAIESAARAQQWEVREIAPGRLLATLVVNNKHTVMTEIGYSPTAYSLTYRDSVNMKYGPGPAATGVIHPAYNRWVAALKDGIRLAVNKS